MRYVIFALLFILLQNVHAFGNELWFESARGMNMGARTYAIYFGKFPSHRMQPGALNGVHVLLKDYTSHIRPLKIKKRRRAYCVRVPAIFNGNYTLIAMKREKNKNVSTVYVAKVNFYVRHQRDGKITRPNDDMAVFGPQVPFELIRLRSRRGEPFFLSRTGHRIRFRVYFHGKPVSGAVVVVTTRSGWSKRMISDKNGEVEFTAIQDRFPASKYRWRPEIYLVSAFYTNSGTRYVATYPIYTYISPDAWRSYAAGIFILLVVMLAVGLWAYFKRRESRF